ncbi:17619_t:CDS:10 [Entrophospora sp. SA101]|nr:17619_t:CDS:10 [Entrophospora sp. SA101]
MVDENNDNVIETITTPTFFTSPILSKLPTFFTSPILSRLPTLLSSPTLSRSPIITSNQSQIKKFTVEDYPMKLINSKSVKDSALYIRKPLKWHEYLGSEEWTFVTFGCLFTMNALVFLSCQWSVQARAFFTCVKAKAIKIIPALHKGKGDLCDLYHADNGEISFTFQKKKYVWDPDKKIFNKLSYPCDGNPPISIFDIPIPTFRELFKEHAVAPFFVFQLFCVGLWLIDDYWYYSLFTLFMLVVFESTVVFQRLKTLAEFRTMSIKPYSIQVRRNNTWITINSDEVLPGDLVSVVRSKEDSGIACDMVLLNGSCIVNEAMLSGESTPLLKESIALRDSSDHLDMNGIDKNSIIFGGTKILQVTPPSPDDSLTAPDNGCIAYVIRTGFGTVQGKLVRTMVYSTEHVSANNIETFLFILFLLVFAISAAGYVCVKGVEKNRKKTKLLYDSIIIITSVVPPELPMELSLAVNTSLVALAKYAIYCTEPFRIPFAGKLDVCAFDKTGTLTGESLVVRGIAGIHPNDPKELTDPKDALRETIQTLAAAHALVKLDDGIVGDPMEKATLEALDWKLGNGDTVIPANNQSQRFQQRSQLQICRRFQFSSKLKRMSSISTLNINRGKKTFVAVKGAPETLHSMYEYAPDDYEDTYKFFTRRGNRVLALGYKYLNDNMSIKEVNDLTRESVECDLKFAGFLIFDCPLKDDAISTIKVLNESSHRVIMITGDNPLTACHVAREVEIINREVLILDLRKDEASDDVDPLKDIDPTILQNYDICVTGAALAQFENRKSVKDLLEHTWVYARVSPGQKEFILTGLKQAGYITLMCGDGTNDVGALKQAHVGVALLDGKPEDLRKIAEHQRMQRLKDMYENQLKFTAKFNMPPPPPPPAIAHLYPNITQQLQQNTNNRRPNLPQAQVDNITEQLLDMEDEPPTIKLGDASVAAPFTSKLSNVVAIANIIRQGRCTLVATIQMYKILALNCLITAYSLSVLYLEGIKYGDLQVTISGVLLAVCFLCISKAKPLENLSKQRPQTNVFNFYIILSILGQFAIHIASLIYVVELVFRYEERVEFDPDQESDPEKEFEPTLLNTAVYLISLSMQVSTFAINYQNTTLYYGLCTVAAIVVSCATEFVPEVNSMLQLVPMSKERG